MNIPLGLSVDEEGGTVTRISYYKFHRSERFPSPHEIYEKSGLDGLLAIEKEKRDLLRKFKMNVNLAPVADFTNNESDYIYGRTLGYPLNETIQYISKEVSEYNEDNFTCCAKHFPGYGNNKNTHDVIAIDERPYEIFEKEDLKPFIAGIEQKIPMILVSHNIVKCKDKNFPASISETWHNILRNELNFSGLILTDDLSMNAIKLYSGGYSPAIIAINAGNDILLTNIIFRIVSIPNIGN
jgi:beta-N-acetylhexosaminidase